MKRLCFLLMLNLILVAEFPFVTLAKDEVNVISSDAQSQFPQAIVFTLEVEAATEIEDIDLEYRVSRSDLVPVSCRVDADFTPGQKVNASWTWNMLETGGLPPGAEVEYWWLIEDADGQQTETSSACVQFDDLRYAWGNLTSDDISLFWYEGDISFAQELLDAAHEALGRLADDIGVSMEQPARLYIYASSSDLQGALVYPQEWTGGVAFFDYGIIAIGISPNDLAWGKRAIAHELGHLVVHQVVFGPYGELPTWLDEGLAMDAEGDLRSDLQRRIDRAVANDELFSVRSISSSFPTDSDEAALCYAESYSVVQFLLDNYGRDKILELLNVFQRGSTYDDALLEVYGFDMDGLNTLWRENLGLGPQPTPDDGGSGISSYFVALIVLGAILVAIITYLTLRRLLRRVV